MTSLKTHNPTPRQRGVTWKSARALILIVGGSVVAVSSWADEKPSSGGSASTLTSAIQVRRLSPAEASRANPVRLNGVVTYADVKWNMLFIHDSTCGVYVNASGLTNQLQAGERVEVDGFLDPGAFNPVVSRARVTVTGKGELPKPSPRTVRTLASGDDDCNWVEVTGTIGSATIKDGHLWLNLNEAGNWIKVLSPIFPTNGVQNLVNAKVRIQGVCGVNAGDRREVISVNLCVPDLSFVTVEEPPAKDPFAMPVRNIGDILNPEGNTTPAQHVRVQGVVQTNAAGGFFIRDRTGGIGIETSATNGLKPGLVLDVVGIVSRVQRSGTQQEQTEQAEKNSPLPLLSPVKASGLLRDVKLRRIGIARTNEFELTDANASSGQAITTVREIRALSPAEAARGRPVRIFCVVTYYDRDWGLLFVQDVTAGIFVQANDYTLDLEVGRWIDLEGVTAPGDFAPIIISPRCQILPQTSMPQGQLYSVKELSSGNKDGQWLQMQGVVRSVKVENGHIYMDVVDRGEHFAAEIPKFMEGSAPTHLVAAKVRLGGVCGTIFNQKRQFTGVRLFVPALEFVTPETSMPADAFALPIRPINSLLQFTSAEETEQRARVQGTVTFCRSNEFLFIQDKSGGLLVRTEQTEPVKVGDRLDVVGFPEVASSTPILAQTVFRKLGAGDPPIPKLVTAEHNLSADADQDIFDAKLVRIQGRLLDLTVGAKGKGKTLIVQQGETVFNAYLTAEDTSQSSLRVGSVLELTGVWSVQVDANRTAKSFQLYLRSPADIVILQSPPWWTIRHTFGLLALLVTIALLTMGWIVALQRRVRVQTDLIQQRLEREKALEVRYRELFESNPQPMWVYDLETLGFVAVNDAAVHHYGYSRADFLRMTLKDIRPASEVDILLKSLNATRDQRIVQGIRAIHCKRNRDLIHVEISSHQLVFAGRKASLVLATDITERLKAEDELDRAHKQLLETSRQAGMAEVASNVLHNVGNVLNSVNVSTAVLSKKIRESKIANLEKAGDLLREHLHHLPEFLTSDPKGSRLPQYLVNVTQHLAAEQRGLLDEVELLARNIEHIKEIVVMQQNYAKVSGVSEIVSVKDLVEDAVQMNAGAFTRHKVQVIREYDEVPPITTQKHKVLQILVNLMRNAKYALDEGGSTNKQMRLRIEKNGGEIIKISVIDNGVGIPAENLTRIFAHGFTTRKNGHGFGLHSGALAAKEMGGALIVHSDGPGKGATFTLELPLSPGSDDNRSKQREQRFPSPFSLFAPVESLSLELPAGRNSTGANGGNREKFSVASVISCESPINL